MNIDQQDSIDSGRYQLIDFGDGRKLECLAGYLIDRPSPSAQGTRRHSPGEWSKAASRFDSKSQRWIHHERWPADLDVDCGRFRMPVSPTPFGHIGLFPEQYDNWHWLGRRRGGGDEPQAALNLFAYTGASTIALAVAGFRVAHVDAAKQNVQSARLAAQHNGLQEAPIRYLVDDAAEFVAREIRRRRCYHTIVLDPPAYGHSPKGKAWRIERDLWPLLEGCLKLIDPQRFRILVTGHSPEVGEVEVRRFLEDQAFFRRTDGSSGLILDSGRSQLRDLHDRSLDSGFYVRASAPSCE